LNGFVGALLSPGARETRVAIVVPLHKVELTPDEAISLRHVQHFLGGYDKILVVPRSLRPGLDGFEVERFPDAFFRSATTFGVLQLRTDFYRRFAGYKHILVYQLDALVLSDRLLEFCAGEFDYIGAPWIDAPWLDAPAVGNGGFSLRRVASFLRVLEARRGRLESPDRHARPLVPRLPGSVQYRLGGNADIFWSFDAVRHHPGFRVASVAEGLRFAFELSPRMCFELNNHELPFGCHAWARYDRAFWEPHLLG
jgi:hypothetical protein